jgi:predicted P-loop ATPase/GTPase
MLCDNFNLLCDIQIPNDKILSHILPSLISLSVSPKNYIHSENQDVGFKVSDCLNYLFFLIVEDASQYIKSAEPILSFKFKLTHLFQIVQIGRILNAHMNSLQWIDQNTALIATHLEQVSKLHDVHRRENERSFHLTYD